MYVGQNLEFANGFQGEVVKTYDDGHFVLECEGAFAACYGKDEDEWCIVNEDEDFTTLNDAIATVETARAA